MSLSMGLSMGLNHGFDHKLSLSQKQSLDFLLKQILVHPENPNMEKGFGGMIRAHEILVEKERTGVLIGGLSAKVWNQRRKKSELSKNKDVDVMVLYDPHFDDSDSQFEKFEGGIDWWLPYENFFEIYDGTSKTSGLIKYWKNGNDVALSFGVKEYVDGFNKVLKSGLYIMSPELVIDMKLAEAQSRIDERVDTLEIGDVDVEEAYEKFQKKTIKTRVPSYIKNKFKGRILDHNYIHNSDIYNAVKIDGYSHKQVVAINSEINK